MDWIYTALFEALKALHIGPVIHSHWSGGGGGGCCVCGHRLAGPLPSIHFHLYEATWVEVPRPRTRRQRDLNRQPFSEFCFLLPHPLPLDRFAYIEFADKESVRTAMALDESLFRGRQIKVGRHSHRFASA